MTPQQIMRGTAQQQANRLSSFNNQPQWNQRAANQALMAGGAMAQVHTPCEDCVKRSLLLQL